MAANNDSIPRVIHLDWCVCSVKDFKVLDSANAFINPGISLDQATTETTQVTQEMLNQQGVSFTEALDKVSSINECMHACPPD